jgi:hypothetical protein
MGQSAAWGAKEIWKVCAPNKCKMFLWQVMHERVGVGVPPKPWPRQSWAMCSLFPRGGESEPSVRWLFF